MRLVWPSVLVWGWCILAITLAEEPDACTRIKEATRDACKSLSKEDCAMVTSKLQLSITDACRRDAQTAAAPSEGCGERIEKFAAMERDSLRNNIRKVEGQRPYAASLPTTGEDEISRLLAPRGPIAHRDTEFGSKLGAALGESAGNLSAAVRNAIEKLVGDEVEQSCSNSSTGSPTPAKTSSKEVVPQATPAAAGMPAKEGKPFRKCKRSNIDKLNAVNYGVSVGGVSPYAHLFDPMLGCTGPCRKKKLQYLRKHSLTPPKKVYDVASKSVRQKIRGYFSEVSSTIATVKGAATTAQKSPPLIGQKFASPKDDDDDKWISIKNFPDSALRPGEVDDMGHTQVCSVTVQHIYC